MLGQVYSKWITSSKAGSVTVKPAHGNMEKFWSFTRAKQHVGQRYQDMVGGLFLSVYILVDMAGGVFLSVYTLVDMAGGLFLSGARVSGWRGSGCKLKKPSERLNRLQQATITGREKTPDPLKPLIRPKCGTLDTYQWRKDA